MNVTEPDIFQEAALCESERHLKLALRAAKMGLWHVDLATSRAVWDEQVHRLHGWEPGTFPGTWEAFCAHIHPEDLPRVRETARTCDAGRRHFRVQFRVRWPDGSVHWLEDHGVLDLDATGVAVGVTGLCVDITARQQTQSRLQTAKEDAERANEATRTAVERLGDAAGASEVLEILGREAVRTTGADGCAVRRRIHRGAGAEFEVAVLFEGETKARGVLAANFAAVLRDAGRREPDGWFARVGEGKFFASDAADAARWFPGEAAYHAARSYRQWWNVPLRLGGEIVGAVELMFRRARPADGLVVQTLETLAMQAGMALRLHRKTDATRETAVARERARSSQARARELEETNTLLSRALQQLSGADSPDALITKLHLELCTLVGGERMSLFRLDWETQRIRGHTVVDAGRSVAEGDAEFIQLDLAFDDVPAWKDSLQEDRVLWMDPRRDAAMMSRWTVDFMLARGYHWLVNLPLFVRGRPAWVVGVMGRDEAGLTPRSLELFRLLGRQLTLALELRWLSGLAREAALNEERNRLAGEIHDSLAQSFAGIAMQLESAEDAALHEEHSGVFNAMRRAREMARFGLAEARRSVLALRPADALAHGLPAALQSLAERSRVDNLLDCRLEVLGPPGPLRAEIETPLFRIAQEAVGNAVRHGRPGQLVLVLEFGLEEIGLRVSDDGCGFDAADARRPALGGLRSVQQRAQSLGGRCEIESAPGRGTTLRVTVPRQPAPEKNQSMP